MGADRETERGGRNRNEESRAVFAGRFFGLLVALVLTCAAAMGTPADATAESPPSGCAGKAVSKTAGAGHGSLKGFVSPGTGEILSYEEALEMELAGKPRTANPGGARATAEIGRKIRLGRRVPLEGGGYIAEIESPLPYVKLKARISPGEATSFQCRGQAETESSPKGGDRE